MNSVLEVLVILPEGSKASYTLETKTTFSELRELLKEDGLIEKDDNDYVFKIDDGDVLIPKSQEKIKTLDQMKVKNDIKVLLVKKKLNINIEREENKTNSSKVSISKPSQDIDAYRASQLAGNFLDDIPGKERKAWPNGDIYEGEMRDGKMYGKGIYRVRNNSGNISQNLISTSESIPIP